MCNVRTLVLTVAVVFASTVSGQQPTSSTLLKLDFSTTSVRGNTTQQGETKFEVAPTTMFISHSLESQSLSWMYDGKYSYLFLPGATVDAKKGFQPAHFSPPFLLPSNEYGFDFYREPKLYEDYSAQAERRDLPKEVLNQIRNPGNFNASMVIGRDGFGEVYAPVWVDDRGEGAARRVTVRIGDEKTPSITASFEKFTQVGDKWIPALINEQTYDITNSKAAGKVKSSITHKLVSATAVDSKSKQTLEQHVPDGTLVSYFEPQGKSGSYVFDKQKGTLTNQLEETLAKGLNMPDRTPKQESAVPWVPIIGSVVFASLALALLFVQRRMPK